ncbi:hypothetical protein B9479_006403 [Cryptococcus floricola]|uniref:Uncharacterized protein n=1 Tax=Cryptococcus floricola TaxID=2591691 RepID=A0A5D3AS11_9TREE|nr:hypothetical protein B9479_006403 [Cryptococcus floricola]
MSRECAVWGRAGLEGFGGCELAEASRNVPLPSPGTDPQPFSLLAPAPPRPTSYPFPISPREQSSTIQALSLAEGASRERLGRRVEDTIKQRNGPLPSTRHEPSVSLLISARPIPPNLSPFRLIHRPILPPIPIRHANKAASSEPSGSPRPLPRTSPSISLINHQATTSPTQAATVPLPAATVPDESLPAASGMKGSGHSQVMSAAAQVAATSDILDQILSHPFGNRDLTSFLRVSPLFFHIAGRKLYSTLPISNALNTVSISGPSGGSSGSGSYGREQLLPYVRTVVVERAPIPKRPIWAGWEELPPLPSVEEVIIRPADTSARQRGGQDTSLPSNALIERLCPSATRLHLATRCYTRGANSLQLIPSLPNVHTLVLKVRAPYIYDVRRVLGDSEESSRPCPNIRQVHLLLWGDVAYPSKAFRRIPWPSKTGVSRRDLMDLTVASYGPFTSRSHAGLCTAIEDLGDREHVKVLHLYNVESVLKRHAEWAVSMGLMNEGTVEDKLREMKEAFCRETKGAGDGDEVSVVSFNPATTFYDTFGLYGGDKAEAWYISAVIKPSARLTALRQQLADRTGEPADHFLGLKEHDVQTVLDYYKEYE